MFGHIWNICRSCLSSAIQKGCGTDIERSQRRATKLVTGLRDIPYENRLKIMNISRYKGDIIEVYKYLHGMYFVPSNSLSRKAPPSALIRGHDYKLLKRHCHSQLRLQFFFCVTSLWNSVFLRKYCPLRH